MSKLLTLLTGGRRYTYDPGLITNGGFETAGSGAIWAGWAENPVTGTIEDETGIVFKGNHSCKITSVVGGTDFVYQLFAVTPGEVYTLSGWARGNGTTAPRYGVRNQTAGIYIHDKVSTGITANIWGSWSVDFVIPAGCLSIAVRLFGPNAAAAGWHDDISLKKN